MVRKCFTIENTEKSQSNHTEAGCFIFQLLIHIESVTYVLKNRFVFFFVIVAENIAAFDFGRRFGLL
jgi:hypothetical protein